ncbi:MAG: hypothetical protein WCY09_10045 [Candidatus Omnitrophota bacterium]|jgi:hypothetical protein
MSKVTLEITDNEARILVRALDIAVSYVNSGEPYEGILGEFNLTPEETLALKAKMQARCDAFNQRLGYEIEPIDWPPTDEALLEYLSSSLEQQLKE